MNYQKGFVVPLVIAIIAILVIVSGILVSQKKAVAPVTNPNATSTATSTIVGNDRDAHGCIGSAGYSWCQVKNKCLRVWEEKCEATSTQSTSTPISCVPKWTCGWTPCKNGYQGMTAVDSNNCGLPETGANIACPALARDCSN